MHVRVNRDRCEGHGRCYALAQQLFDADELGHGRERGDGSVPTGFEERARLAAANCPERAVMLLLEDLDG